MAIAKGAHHGTHYLVEELEFVDGVATVDVSDHDNATVLLRGGQGDVRPTGWKVPLPALTSERDGEFCIQVDLRGVPSVDIVTAAGGVEGVLFASITGTDW